MFQIIWMAYINLRRIKRKINPNSQYLYVRRMFYFRIIKSIVCRSATTKVCEWVISHSSGLEWMYTAAPLLRETT